MRLIDIDKFSKKLDVRRPRGYELARQLPAGIRVEVGRQIRINEEKFDEWIGNGGKFEPIYREPK